MQMETNIGYMIGFAFFANFRDNQLFITARAKWQDKIPVGFMRGDAFVRT